MITESVKLPNSLQLEVQATIRNVSEKREKLDKTILRARQMNVGIAYQMDEQL